MAVFPETLRQYADTYLADLLLPLPEAERDRFATTLAIGYMGGPFPSRLLVQRLVEVTVGTITREQYRSWVLSDKDGKVSGVAHTLKSLANGFLVGGDRETMLVYLANAEVDRGDVKLITEAGAAGLLTDQEVQGVLEHALSLPPLPGMRPLPDGLEPLPPDFPEPRRESPFFVEPPGSAEQGS